MADKSAASASVLRPGAVGNAAVSEPNPLRVRPPNIGSSGQLRRPGVLKGSGLMVTAPFRSTRASVACSSGQPGEGGRWHSRTAADALGVVQERWLHPSGRVAPLFWMGEFTIQAVPIQNSGMVNAPLRKGGVTFQGRWTHFSRKVNALFLEGGSVSRAW